MRQLVAAMAADHRVSSLQHAEISRQRNLTLNGVCRLHRIATGVVLDRCHVVLVVVAAVVILQHQRGNYGHALTLYNKVVQSETTMAQLHDRQVDPRFLLNRGDTYLKINQLQQVRRTCVLSWVWPASVVTHYSTPGHVPCATQALADFHRALDSDPKNATTRRRLAVVHDMFGVQLFNEGLVAQAEVEFSTAIEYNPGVAQFFVHRGNAAMYLQVRGVVA